MDGVLLWDTVYRVVTEVDARWENPVVRRGHPDEYSMGDIALCWLWSCFQNLPLSVAARGLADPNYRRAQRCLGLRLPKVTPHETTIARRTRRLDFWLFLTIVGQFLIKLLKPDRSTALIDSMPMPMPYTSRDRSATWGHHGMRGYRFHSMTSVDRVILTWAVHGANVHELTVAPILVREASNWGWRPRYVGGDDGYDSEPLHECVRDWLGATMVAPFNDRGGSRAMLATPLRRRLSDRWKNRAVQGVMRLRPEIERMHSILKSSLIGLYALPPWVRGQHRVERWIASKVILYHAYLLNRRPE